MDYINVKNHGAKPLIGRNAARAWDKRQMRDLRGKLKREIKDRKEYKAQKAALIERVIKSGGLEMVKMNNGEIVAVDKDRTFSECFRTGKFFRYISA
jgi:hypothetical protein